MCIRDSGREVLDSVGWEDEAGAALVDSTGCAAVDVAASLVVSTSSELPHAVKPTEPISVIDSR